jgi:transposase
LLSFAIPQLRCGEQLPGQGFSILLCPNCLGDCYIKQFYRTIEQLEQRLNQQLCQLSHQNFRCEADARLAADRFAKKLKYHALEAVTVTRNSQYTRPGRPRKDSQPVVTYRLAASLVRNPIAIQETIASSGRFILATNVTNPQELSDFQVLQEYKQQQAPERGFRFLKDPLFFTSSVCLKSPERVAAMAMVMGLCLLVYSLGQRQLRQTLAAMRESLKDQLGKATQSPTLRWIFQCFQDVHLFQVAGAKGLANLTPERRWILRFLDEEFANTICCVEGQPTEPIIFCKNLLLSSSA